MPFHYYRSLHYHGCDPVITNVLSLLQMRSYHYRPLRYCQWALIITYALSLLPVHSYYYGLRVTDVLSLLHVRSHCYLPTQLLHYYISSSYYMNSGFLESLLLKVVPLLYYRAFQYYKLSHHLNLLIVMDNFILIAYQYYIVKTNLNFFLFTVQWER